MRFKYIDGEYKSGQITFDEAIESKALGLLQLEYLLGIIDVVEVLEKPIPLSTVLRDLGWLEARESKKYINRLGVFKLAGIYSTHKINLKTDEKALRRSREDYELYAQHATPDINLIIGELAVFNNTKQGDYNVKIKARGAELYELYSAFESPDICIATRDLASLFYDFYVECGSGIF